MNQTEIIVIAGLGRCGTSLVMQMLSAAGITCAGEHPSYEPPEMLTDAPPREFLEIFEGGAVKFLDPHRKRLPEGLNYRVLFLTRSRRQQAMSNIKFLSALGIQSKFAAMPLDTWRAKLLMDERQAFNAFRKLGCHFATLRFEDLIERSENAVAVIAEFLGIDEAKESDMLAQIRPRPHGAQCYPGLLELQLMQEAETEP